jgi:hypothetical protein
VATRLVQDVTFDAVDADDWPEGEEELDGAGFVSSLIPGDWSPPPGISPFEACRGVEGRSFIECVPDTEITYQAYYRNYSVEQEVFGRVLGAVLELRAQDGYLFESTAVRFIVPALNGDSVEE